MPEEPEEPAAPDTAGGRVVVTGEAVVYKGGRKRAQETSDRDERPEEER